MAKTSIPTAKTPIPKAKTPLEAPIMLKLLTSVTSIGMDWGGLQTQLTTVVAQVANGVAAQVANGVATQVANGVATQVANQVANQVTNEVANCVADQWRVQGVQGGVQAGGSNRAQPAKKKSRGKRATRCGAIQSIITQVMLDGLKVADASVIGSDDQPGPDNVNGNNKSPWQFNFEADPEDEVNCKITKQWVHDVMHSKGMEELRSKGKITGDQFHEDYVQNLLIHSLDLARKNIKINEDKTGVRKKKLAKSKYKSKWLQRQKDLATNQLNASKNWKWGNPTRLPIPEIFFLPEYQLDSESNPMPDLSCMRNPIQPKVYCRYRASAAYEMLTPGWRSHEITLLFHALDKKHRKDTGNRP
ncbi:hypothetical protein FRC07_012810 [Ceratobasidium sp. 392]|nr:hypothetical protein FRC07_012810 [Ceratobasidium sp. 392]